MRAYELLKSGSILHSTIKCVYCAFRLDNKELLLLKMYMCPSMKIKVVTTIESTENDKLYDHHAACVSFDLVSGELVTCPYTICGCYDRRNICSHMLGLLCFIRGTQRSDEN